MFEKLSVDRSYEPFYRDTTKHKSIKVLAKIDGENWYDISYFVKKITVNNQIQLLDTPTIDTAKLTVKNDNNAFTSTVYNDEFNPSAGKINGTIEQGYLNKIWEVQVYTVIYDVDSRDCLDMPDGAIAYFRYSLVDIVNGITPEGYELTPDTLLDVAIPLFRGWKPAQAITEKHKEAEIELKDILWITTQKRLKNPLLYTSMTPNAIIADLLERCGLGEVYQDLQTLNTTFDVFIAEQDKSYWQVIQQICEATAGVISMGPDGKIIYRTRIENFTDPEIALTINQDTFSKYNLEQKAKYNQLKVESEGYEISTSNEDLLVDTTLTGDAAIIKAGQTQNFEFEYTSEYAKDFADTVFITVKQGDTIVDNLGAFSQGDDDGYIRLNKLTAYPDKLVLNITNLASTVDYTIAQVRFRGRQIKKLSLNSVEELNVTDEPDNEISIKSYYSDTSILSNVLDALKFNINKDIVFSLSLNEFYPDIFAGNLVNFNIPLKGIASGTFIIEQIKHIINDDLSYNTELVISEWKDVIFDINNKEIYKSTPVEVITESANQSQIEEIVGSIDELKEDMQEQKDITSYLDGVAPNTPTGLIVTTEVINRESVLKVSFNPNTELDLLGYEIAYSQDSVWWQYNVVSETSVYIQVIGNTEYFVKVRAFDAEGFKSAWTNVVSIVSAKDTIPPEAPTGLTVEPLFQKIIVKWTPNEEPDLLKYKVQVSLDNFVTVKDTIYTVSNYIVYGGKTNTLYYFRVSAIDTSENMSEYSNVVSATTAAVYDEDLESEILDGLTEDLEELNNVTLPELQEDLQELQDLTGFIDGVVPSVPTGLTLTTELLNNEAVIKVSFNANTETDIIGYEIAYSIDQVKWHYVTTTDTTLYFSVIANTLYYVRVRAFDAEGFKSAWTSTTSITSAKDTIAPSEPTGLTVEALFQKIILRWNANTENDFEKYKIQVSTNNFSTVKETFYSSSNYLVYSGQTNTQYYFRVSVIDTSGNESAYSSVISATTAAVYDEDLESAILNELNENLEELNNVTLPGLQEDLQELQDLTGYLDGEAPNTPTGLALDTELIDDEAVIEVSFNANTETDVIGYEIAYSTDQVKWSYVNTTEISLYISVIPNTRYYVRIRAFDAEGYKSSWTSTQSIVSAKDITSPSTPSGLVVEALFQKIVLKWNPNTEKDFEKYKVQVSKDNFTTVEETLYTSSNYLVYGGDTDTKYYFRVSAIDTSGNESNFSAIVNATTAKVYDEDLESEILNGLADDLEELNTVTLPNLQSELDSKLDDLPGEIKETHIADNSISTAKIKANAVTANEINAGAVTSSKIAASAITSNHIGANQIITNTANIATGIIDTVHIKDAAIKEAKIADAAITNAKIANLAVDDAKISNLDAAKITSGYIDADRIDANSITVSKLVAKPAFSIPEGAIAYFTDSLVDNVSGITPVGYDEINLSPKITLMPENAPKGSIIAPLMMADKIYADHIASNAITSDKILANAVTSDKIAANAITANKIGTNQIITNSANIANGIIDTAHIKDAAIETAKIKDAAITNAKIANLAVDDAKIANLNAAKINAGYISADRIASNAITSAKIAAGAITAEKVASNAITSDKILANAVTSDKIAANAITANKIGTNQIITNSANIATGVIETAHIKDAAISTAKIANAAITNAKIGTAAVDTANIADLAVTNAKIADLAVDNAKIANLDAAKITSGYIDADRIEAGSITADHIATDFIINAGQYIQAGTEDRNYKLDGTQGLIRGIYGTNYNIPVIVKHGILNFDGTYRAVLLDISELHLTDFYVMLNILNGNTDTYNSNRYMHLSWQRPLSNPNALYIYWSYFTPGVWQSATDVPTISSTLPTERGVWTAWVDFGGGIVEVMGLKLLLKYYKGSTLSGTRNAIYFDPSAIIIAPKVRHRKAPIQNTIETEINWNVDGKEIISSTILPSDPTAYTRIDAEITHFNIFGSENPIGNLEYTIIGY